MFAVISFLLHPIQFTREMRQSRRDFDSEGRYIGNGPFWRDGSPS